MTTARAAGPGASAPLVEAAPGGPQGAPGEGPDWGEPQPFRLADDLPAGVTLLEASAGTGKTHTIAALAVRYLAEDLAPERLLVVTFTRSATSELRSRVRTRLVAAEAGLRATVAGYPPAGDDLVALLASGAAGQVEARQVSLARAVAGFDAATITTIHGFCEQVLGGLGTAADCGRDRCFVDDLGGVVEEVVDDLYLRKFLDSDQPPPFALSCAGDIVGAAVANRYALVEPRSAEPGTTAALRANLAARGRDEVLRRARLGGLIGYDDQIDRLRATLTGPSASVAVQRLRERFAVVLVDEFQDTDPVQWEIFRLAFAESGAPLLLIGDPKQAIYNFRGADVWAYLAAASAADQRSTLTTNWRSDQPLLDALDALFDGATLGDPAIRYRGVRAAPGHDAGALAGATCLAPLRLRLLHRSDGLVELTMAGLAQVGSARAAVAADLADDIVALLSAGATLARAPHEPAPVVPGDLAVLVRANNETTIVHDALDAVGVPSVISGGGSVFATVSASHWLTFLEALAQPAATSRARAAALTPFVGWDATHLAAAGDTEVGDLHADLHRWAGVLAASGVASLTETISAEVGLAARELARTGGERRLTDLRHVSELLHAEALAAGTGARALAAWLSDRISLAGTDPALDERSRRLDSDAAAVQIQTVHRSKGLEFPIVYLPYLWSAFPDKDELPLYHDPDQGDQRTIDVGGDRPDGYQAHRRRASEERRGEDLRQAYVAFTRARHQVVVWWASGQETKSSSLARFLLGRGGDGSVLPRPALVPADDSEVEARMHDLAVRAAGRISVERVGRPRGKRWQRPLRPEGTLEVGTFDRSLDAAWRRLSYTSLTAASHSRGLDPPVATEAEDPGVTDEASGTLVVAVGEAAGFSFGEPAGVTSEGGAVASPMASLPAGPEFGVAFHAVLAGLDFSAGDLDSAVASRVAEVIGRRAGHSGAPDPVVLAAALRLVLDTSLGPLAGGLRLRDVRRGDRLDELGFELPLAGGDAPLGDVAVADVAGCLRRWLPTDDPLVAYPDRLDAPELAHTLRGFLTGSIDLVLRSASGEGNRYLVADYKTNWLASPGEILTTSHYRPDRLVAAMAAQHYPLQAVLYSVALHRYLRWRLPAYDPERHLGGVLYLFVRGMAGPPTPVVDGTPCGVFAWDPPAGMTVELSDILDGTWGVAR